jgi:hypothetical protein
MSCESFEDVKGTSAPIGITHVVGFSMQNFSEQIEKRGQLANQCELFVRSCIGMRSATIGIAASLVQDGPWGLGRRGQVLNWIGAKRYELPECATTFRQAAIVHEVGALRQRDDASAAVAADRAVVKRRKIRARGRGA